MNAQTHIEPTFALKPASWDLLPQLRSSDCGRITGFTNEQLSGKFISMGILPGSFIRLVRRLPFSGSYYVQVNDSFFALRKEEAAAIIIEK